jgi:hypothetical protein
MAAPVLKMHAGHNPRNLAAGTANIDSMEKKFFTWKLLAAAVRSFKGRGRRGLLSIPRNKNKSQWPCRIGPWLASFSSCHPFQAREALSFLTMPYRPFLVNGPFLEEMVRVPTYTMKQENMSKSILDDEESGQIPSLSSEYTRWTPFTSPRPGL